MQGSILSICSIRFAAWVAVAAIFVAGQAAQAQLIPYNPRVERGATVGGVTGAVIGGVIGKQNDETVEGALIGGAVGAIAGGIVGHSQNQRDAQMRAAQQRAYNEGYRASPNYYQQRQYRPSPAQHVYTQPAQPTVVYHDSRPSRVPVAAADIVAMTRRGFPDRLIIQHIQLNGVRSAPTTEELLKMYDEGVSTEVIEAMQEYVLVQEGTVITQQSTTTTITTNPGLVAPPTLERPQAQDRPQAQTRPQTQPQARTTYRRRY